MTEQQQKQQAIDLLEKEEYQLKRVSVETKEYVERKDGDDDNQGGTQQGGGGNNNDDLGDGD